MRTGLTAVGLLLHAAAAATDTATPLDFGAEVEARVGIGGWADFSFTVPDDSANVYIEASTVSDRPDALGLYVYEGALPLERTRKGPSTPIDADESSAIVKNGARTYSVVLGQCYVQPATKYFVAVRGGSERTRDDVRFKLSATLVPARLELGAKVSASVCDQRYLHFYWQLDASLAAGARSPSQGAAFPWCSPSTPRCF
jgi:hypothetical protein